MEDRFAGHEANDRSGEKIGKVDDPFVDESDQPQYVGAKMGLPLWGRCSLRDLTSVGLYVLRAIMGGFLGAALRSYHGPG